MLLRNFPEVFHLPFQSGHGFKIGEQHQQASLRDPAA